MTDSPITRLKDGTSITIDGKDVERIRILNDIVWEKARATTLTLQAPESIVVKQTFTLKAYLVDNHGEVVNGNIIFSGPGANKTVKAVNGIAEVVIDTKNFDFQNDTFNTQRNGYIYTYTARFERMGRYLASNSTKEICIKKDTPKIEIVGLQNGKNNLYYQWHIGCRLTDVNGDLIKNQPVCISINGRKYPRLTNEKGIAPLLIRFGVQQLYTATFTSRGSALYNSNTRTQEYNYLQYQNTKLPFLAHSLGENSAQKDWIQIDTNKYQCGQLESSCNNSNGIQVNNEPDTLKITFNKNNTNSNIYQVKLTFNSYSLTNKCYNPPMGGWFKTEPDIKLSRDGTNFSPSQSTILKFPSEYNIHYGYSSHNKLSQSIIWESIDENSNYNQPFIITTNPIVSFKYPKNEGIQEGAIQLSNIALTIAEVPLQNFDFGEITVNKNDDDCNNYSTLEKGITSIEMQGDNLLITTISNYTVNQDIDLITDIKLKNDGNIEKPTIKTFHTDSNLDKNIITDIEIDNNSKNIIIRKS